MEAAQLILLSAAPSSPSSSAASSRCSAASSTSGSSGARHTSKCTSAGNLPMRVLRMARLFPLLSPLATDTCPQQDWRTYTKGAVPVMRGVLRGIAPEFWPVTGALAQKQARGHLVQYRTVVAGMSGRGTSSLLPNYSSYYADTTNLVWYLRQYYL